MTNEELLATRELNGLMVLLVITLAVLAYNYWRINE